MSLLIERRASTAVITIDRPDRRNAVDGPTARALDDAMVEFDADPDVLAIVLTGSEGTFCAGADLKAMADGQGNRVGQDAPDIITDSLGPMGPTRRILDTPTIAAIEGHAVAGGLELALWCDLRVAASDAVFGVYCRRWGVPLIDGGTVRLPRLIGQSRAMDLILTGRAVDGVEAHDIGLANRLCAPGQALDEAIALADSLAAFPQICLRGDHRSAVEQWGLPLADALANEVTIGLATIRSGETIEGASRFTAGAGRHGSFTDTGTSQPSEPS